MSVMNFHLVDVRINIFWQPERMLTTCIHDHRLDVKRQIQISRPSVCEDMNGETFETLCLPDEF